MPLRHLSTSNIARKIPLEPPAKTEFENKLDQHIPEAQRTSQTTSKSQKYSHNAVRRSFNSKRNSSEEIAVDLDHTATKVGRTDTSPGKNFATATFNTPHTVGIASSTEVNTNFESLINRYKGTKQQIDDQNDDEGGNARKRKKSTEVGQAQQFKSILEKPIGRMWFPSLGNVAPAQAMNNSCIPYKTAASKNCTLNNKFLPE